MKWLVPAACISESIITTPNEADDRNWRMGTSRASSIAAMNSTKRTARIVSRSGDPARLPKMPH